MSAGCGSACGMTNALDTRFSTAAKGRSSNRNFRVSGFRRTRGASALDLAHHDLGDSLRVGLAARGLHHGSDDDTHRLHIAALELLDDIRVGLERRVDGRLDGAVASTIL